MYDTESIFTVTSQVLRLFTLVKSTERNNFTTLQRHNQQSNKIMGTLNAISDVSDNNSPETQETLTEKLRESETKVFLQMFFQYASLRR